MAKFINGFRMLLMSCLVASVLYADANPAKARQTRSQVAIIPEADALFIQNASQIGLAQVELSKLAAACAPSRDVQQLAARLADFYMRANIQLNDLAAGKDMNIGNGPMKSPRGGAQISSSIRSNETEAWPKADVMPNETRCGNRNTVAPETLVSRFRVQYEHLAGLGGQEFRRAYIRYLIQNCDEGLAVSRQESSSGRDARVKEWARSEMNSIREHLRLASRLQ